MSFHGLLQVTLVELLSPFPPCNALVSSVRPSVCFGGVGSATGAYSESSFSFHLSQLVSCLGLISEIERGCDYVLRLANAGDYDCFLRLKDTKKRWLLHEIPAIAMARCTQDQSKKGTEKQGTARVSLSNFCKKKQQTFPSKCMSRKTRAIKMLQGTILDAVKPWVSLTHLEFQSNDLCRAITDLAASLTCTTMACVEPSLVDLETSACRASDASNHANLQFPEDLRIPIKAQKNLPGIPRSSPKFPQKLGGKNQDSAVAEASVSTLTYLGLSINDLQGAMPEAVASLASLQHLDMSENRLCGAMPEAVASLANLATFVLRVNGLRGAVPAALASLVKLTALILRRNTFQGVLPLDGPCLPTGDRI